MKLTKIEIILALASIATFAILVVIIVISTYGGNKQNVLRSTAPTTFPSNTTGSTSPVIKYDPTGNKKLQEYIENKNNAPAKDLQLREALINNLFFGKTGTIYASSNINIHYLKVADIFQGEILTTNINSAKQEAVDWFVGQGVSKQAVCKLPLMFFLNSAVLEQLKDTGFVFSPLPPGC